MFKYKSFILLVFILLGGCELLSKGYDLDITIPNNESTIGSGKEVAVEIIDKRINANKNFTKINDLENIIFREINDNLTAKGFKVSNDSSSKSSNILTIKIISLVARGSGIDPANSNMNIKVIAKNKYNKVIKTFTKSNAKVSLWVDNLDRNNVLNITVSEVLNEMLNNKQILSILSS